MKAFVLLFLFGMTNATSQPVLVPVDKEAVRKMFIMKNGDVQECFKKVSETQKINGKVVLDFDIDDSGKAKRVEVSKEKSTLDNKDLNECLIAKVKSWPFPPAQKGKTVQIFYPLAFSSK